ncbi:MAG: RecX family [Gaiellaceae bacterium]|nr:RecX family [Gaiellaceae bacterium]
MAERPDAVQTALRALRSRDRTAAELDARLRERGVAEQERQDALEALARAGYVDDERVAVGRAAALAARGSGDALIRDDLERRGLPAELVQAALAGLEPERLRAEAVVSRRGIGPKTARYLAARGFAGDVVAAAVAQEGSRALE